MIRVYNRLWTCNPELLIHTEYPDLGRNGEPDGPYGAVLVEWTGLSDDLMGSPGGGHVSDEMIEILIKAYGGAESE